MRVDHKNQIIKYICFEKRNHLRRSLVNIATRDTLHNLGNIKKPNL